MARERRILAVSVLFLSLAALAVTFQCCAFSLSFLLMQSSQLLWFEFGALAHVTRTRPQLGRLPHLETFTCQNVTLVDRVTLPGRLGNPPRGVTPPIMQT